MDLSETIAPKSDQLNAEDLLSGPRTVTITDVTAGNAEQPVNIVTQEFGPGRPFKPAKTVRRLIVAAWGANSAAYIGRRMTLFRDPDIRFGKDLVGGIRVSAMSHIEKPLTIALTVTRGKRAPFTVQPLVDASTPTPPADWAARVNAAATVDELTHLHRTEAHKWFTDEVRAAFTKRREELSA